VIALRKIKAFHQDENLVEFRQADLRKESLEFWQIENSARTEPPHNTKPDDVCINILRNGKFNVHMEDLIQGKCFEINWKFLHDGSCNFFLQISDEFLFMSCRRSQIHFHNF